MIDTALVALDALFDPMRLAALFAGMLVGGVFGMLPGLGGVAAVSILLPFVYYLDDYSGLPRRSSSARCFLSATIPGRG